MILEIFVQNKSIDYFKCVLQDIHINGMKDSISKMDPCRKYDTSYKQNLYLKVTNNTQ